MAARLNHFTKIIVLLCSSLLQVRSEEYYIKANSSDLCTVTVTVPCQTLDHIVANFSDLLNSNDTLVFNPGAHYLSIDATITDTSNFTMSSKLENLTTRIICENYTRFIFDHSNNIHISNLEFVRCGGNQVVNVVNFVVIDTIFRGQENSGTGIELINTTAEIVNCTFLSNKNGKHINRYSAYWSWSESVGSAIIANQSNININQSTFENNGAHDLDEGGAIYAEKQSVITIDDSKFIDNRGQHGSIVHSRSCNVIIRTSEFYNNSGGYRGLFTLCSSNATIDQSVFENNTGGVLYLSSGIVKIKTSRFYNNSVSYGALITSYSSNATIDQSMFDSNTGGVLYSVSYGDLITSHSSTATIERSVFKNNIDPQGFTILLYFSSSTVKINIGEFYNNVGYSSVVASLSSDMAINGSTFDYNRGIVLDILSSNSAIDQSTFKHNIGSVMLISVNTKVTVMTSEFDNNSDAGSTRIDQKMVLKSSDSTARLINCNFTNNKSPVIVAFDSVIEYFDSFLIMNNSAENEYTVIRLYNSEFIGHDSGNTTISNNMRSLVAFSSNITFRGYARFSHNHNQGQQIITVKDSNLQEGGAITLVQSNLFLDGTCMLEYNQAENGGAILSIEGKLYVTGNLTIAHNIASRNGGGVYLIESEVKCLSNSSFLLFNNTATHKGGGIHAISSYIKAVSIIKVTQRNMDTAIMNFTNNTAQRGGGLSLESNAKLVIRKLYKMLLLTTYYPFTYNQSYATIFSGNSANYGGAIYVNDDTNSGTCTKTECFFQVLACIVSQNRLNGTSDTSINYIRDILKPKSLYFSENNASISGSTLYGGLLDRCAVNQFSEVHITYEEEYRDGGNGIAYFKHVSTVTDALISSLPLKVCLCMDNEHNCTHQSRIEVEKGKTFTVSLASINQINHPVDGSIQASLNFVESAVASGQATREIPAKCTNLTFNVFSPRSTEQLTLYVLDRPCKDADLSKISIDINFLPCSCLIGLQPVETNDTICLCECHSDILQYVDECNSSTGAFLRKPLSRAWITFTTDNDSESSGYLVYPNCPFDYCNSLNVSIDLNQPNGADAQCAFNRSSLLCGSCRPGLSLSLGSSRCLSCPSYWPALLISITIAAIIAGIALVTLLLVLNMTVAVGTLNGLIFCANVVHANKDILFPFQETNFITVFISWLNLELGIDTCYFPGMDEFGKTWLQLAFPAYMIFLVALVIIISSYSSRFSNLIGKKNPVSTLATLILLSYAKLLEVSFKSLSFSNLNYPDGLVKMVWLPDATVNYLSGKHVILFLAAVLILLVGLVYTALLFSWQWLLHLPRWRMFRWIRGQKLQTFIEIYHAPYVPKHRYWTGLLLITRAILYLVAAVNVSNDPIITLTAMIVALSCILALKGSRVYRKWPVDILETLFYLNVLLFTTFTWYCLGECRNKKAAAYTSVSITFITLLFIILYHIYTYTTIFSKVKAENYIMIGKLFTASAPKPKPESHCSAPLDDDIHRFNELLDIIDRPVNTSDYKVPLKKKPVQKPTQSVVEMHHPQLVPHDPEEANSQSNSEIRL